MHWLFTRLDVAEAATPTSLARQILVIAYDPSLKDHTEAYLNSSIRIAFSLYRVPSSLYSYFPLFLCYCSYVVQCRLLTKYTPFPSDSLVLSPYAENPTHW